LNGAIEKHKKNKTKIPLGKVKNWCVQILDGLDFLHTKKVIHFDIKPQNILLDELERIKLGDLGLARNFKSLSSKSSFIGTIPYMSPEVIKQESGIDFKTDIWSFGCVLYEMMTFKMLFENKSLMVVTDITSKVIVLPPNTKDADLAFTLEKYNFILC
jgi:NIMA (never in mitosis gene a)-related kinase